MHVNIWQVDHFYSSIFWSFAGYPGDSFDFSYSIFLSSDGLAGYYFLGTGLFIIFLTKSPASFTILLISWVVVGRGSYLFALL